MRLFSFRKKKKPFDLEAVLMLPDDTAIELAIADYLSEKSAIGDRLDVLNEQQRYFLLIEKLIVEVNHGGFFHYFYGWTGAYAVETVKALDLIGATKIKALLEKAIAALPGPLTADTFERRNMLDAKEDELEAVLKPLENNFYSGTGSIDDFGFLLAEFVRRNKESFRN